MQLKFSYQLYLSAWEVSTDSLETVSDLLLNVLDLPQPYSSAQSSFSAVHVPTLKHATSILSKLPSVASQQPHPAHLFVRVLLRSEMTNTTSSLHFVDIVSSAKAFSSAKTPPSKGKRFVSALGRQHHAMGKIVTQLAEGGGQSELLSSARETKFTQLIAPLLCGNNRTWLVGHMSRLTVESKETATTLKLLGQAAKIMSGCVKNQGNGADGINFLPHTVQIREKEKEARQSRQQQEARQEQEVDSEDVSVDR